MWSENMMCKIIFQNYDFYSMKQMHNFQQKIKKTVEDAVHGTNKRAWTQLKCDSMFIQMAANNRIESKLA